VQFELFDHAHTVILRNIVPILMQYCTFREYYRSKVTDAKYCINIFPVLRGLTTLPKKTIENIIPDSNDTLSQRGIFG